MLVLYGILLYLFFCKVVPFLLYPNYLRPGRVERYPALVDLARKLRGADREETLRNAYTYLREYHPSNHIIWKWESLKSLFLIGDFSTEPYLGKLSFLWCHTQNRLLKSLLVNSGHFEERDIRIGRMFFRNHNSPTFGFSVFIHQYALVDIGNKTVKADPFYGVFQI